MQITAAVEDIDEAYACIERAKELVDRDELIDALKNLNRAVELIPELPHSRWNRVLVLFSIGDYPAASAELEWRRKLFPVEADRF